MNVSAAFSGRKDFLLRIVEQFRELADEIGAPFKAEAYLASDEAVLRIERQGQEETTLCITARFVDDDVLHHRLVLRWEDCQGEVTKLLGLGWTQTLPASSAGIDTPADCIDDDSEYSAGKVIQALRTDIKRALLLQAGLAAHLPALQSRPALPAENFSREAEAIARASQQPLPARPSGQSPAPLPNIKLLQATLGELATAGQLKAENVFASFIATAMSRAALKQGDIATYAQGALLELALFNAAFLRRDSTRISDLGIPGGHLRNYVAKSKAALFQQDEKVLRQVAREMVTGMRLFYAEALAHAGVPQAEAGERLRAAFGKEGAIANEAITILRQAEPEEAKARSPLRRLWGCAPDGTN